jgi:hypothetical protein
MAWVRGRSRVDMSDERYRRILLEIAARACEQLFEHYGVELAAEPSPADDHAPLLCCGVAGFHGPGIAGNVILGASRDVLTRSSPTSSPAHRDWTAELANQFVGRMKNQLLEHGVELEQLATPAVIRGPDINAGRWQHLPQLTYRGPGDGSLVRIWLDIELGVDFEMLEEPDPSRAGAREGETLLF